jgi:multimeric flavodoxin WrbA
MKSAKSGVSRVLGLPAKLISVPKATIRGCHVLTVTVDEAKCSYRNDEETIRHLILSCPR